MKRSRLNRGWIKQRDWRRIPKSWGLKHTKVLRTGGYQQASYDTISDATKAVKDMMKNNWVRYAGIYKRTDLGFGGKGKYAIAYSSKPLLSKPLKIFMRD